MEKIKEGRTQRYHNRNLLLVGLVFVAVGILLIGRNAGWIDGDIFRILVSWQMLLIVIGALSFINRNYTGGLIVAGVGAFFLIPRITDAGAGWVSTYWPVVFIMVGVVIILRLLIPSKFREEKTHVDNMFTRKDYRSGGDGFIDSECIFGSVKHIVLDPVFRGARLKTTFAGTVLDLRQTTLEAAETFVDVECTFGGVEIYIPTDWLLVSDITPSIGGVEDKRFRTSGPVDSEHRLILRGKVTFGGVEIKN